MNAAQPPAFCASAMTCSVKCRLAGRFGAEHFNHAAAGEIRRLQEHCRCDRAGRNHLTGSAAREPSIRTEPFPNCLSICTSADCMARRRSSVFIDKTFQEEVPGGACGKISGKELTEDIRRRQALARIGFG